MFPVITLAIGAVFKIILNWVLLGIPSMGIIGSALSSLACYAFAAIFNTMGTMNRLHLKYDLFRGLFLPVLSTIAMGLAVWGFMSFFGAGFSNIMLILISAAIGAMVYSVFLLLTGAIRRRDMVLLPQGGRLVDFLEHLKLLRK